MNTHVKVIGLTPLGSKPKFTTPQADARAILPSIFSCIFFESYFFAFCNFDPTHRKIKLVKSGWKYLKEWLEIFQRVAGNISKVTSGPCLLLTLYWSESSKEIGISQTRNQSFLISFN